MFHLIWNAPGSRHIIEVVDHGQAHHHHDYIIKILTLTMKVLGVLYPEYWQSMVDSILNLKPKDVIPISKIKHNSINNLLQSK